MDLSSSSLSISSMPKMLWNFYIDYLWNWTDHPNSWVSRIAYTSRVLAILLIMPIVVLTLLDLASYGIARTLGVIDDVKASTSDKETIHNKIPLVRVQRAPGTPSPDSASLLASTDSETLLDASERLQQQHPHSQEPNSSFDFSSSADTLPRLGINTTVPSVSHPDAYFTSGDHSLKLSGVGVFSPAASRPPSPTITRKHLPLFEDKLTDVGEDEGITIRKRAGKGSQEQRPADEQ